MSGLPIVGRTPPSDEPALMFFTPAGPMNVNIYAYRIVNSGVLFIPYDGNARPADSVEAAVGSFIIQRSHGTEYRADEIDAKLESKKAWAS